MSRARFYREAGEVIDGILAKKGAVKNLCLSSKCRRKKQLYAIVCETLKNREDIEAVLKDTDWKRRVPALQGGLVLVLVHDLLFGPGVQCGGALMEQFDVHKAELEEAFAKVKKRTDYKPAKPKHSIPRHARINTILTRPEHVLSFLEEEGFRIVDKRTPAAATAAAAVASDGGGGEVKVGECVVDEHIGNVLCFPSKTDFHDHELYNNGHLILQQKSSCMPAAELSPPPGATVIDACAAPGNKTTHLSAMMNNTGCIHAFDKSPKRLKTLKKMCETAGATCVKARLQDFLKTDPMSKELRNVSYILADPTCSGSGMVDRLDQFVNTDEDETQQAERLAKLSSFQKQIVLHAMSFPSAQHISYSTCSIHAEEDEDVVTAVLEQSPDWELVKALPQWHRRGLSSYACGESCVRVLPEDGTSGFFLAHFRRCSSSMKPSSSASLSGASSDTAPVTSHRHSSTPSTAKPPKVAPAKPSQPASPTPAFKPTKRPSSSASSSDASAKKRRKKVRLPVTS